VKEKKPVQHLCRDCGMAHGVIIPELAQWYSGKCDSCNQQVPVTSCRKYGVWEVPRVDIRAWSRRGISRGGDLP